MIAAGIDIGFAHSGVAIFDTAGDIPLFCDVINSKKENKKHGLRVADDDVRRCSEMYRSLRDCLRDYRVKAVFVELPTSGGKSARPISCMARAQAIIACLVEETRMAAEWLTPNDVKVAMTGKRDASKEEIQSAVLKLCPAMKKLEPEQTTLHEHAYDAAATYFTGKKAGNLYRVCAMTEGL